MTTPHSAGNADAASTAPAPLLRPWWRRSRLWFVFAALIVCAAIIKTADSAAPGSPLDPNSASKDGSRAVAQLLSRRGVVIHRATSIADLTGSSTVVVTSPELYSDDQLRTLAANHRLVLLEPTSDQLAILDGSLAQLTDRSAGPDSVPPGCRAPGAVAAGTVDFTDALLYADESCYRGRIVIRERFVAIGSADLITNRRLGHDGVAALAINLITDNGRVTDISWLLAAADPEASQTSSVWSLFPDWTVHAVWWLVGLGMLLALWRGRRFGPVVTEPLPVVVRAAEVVEGHGRLYRRAEARQSAATALRGATTRRLATHLGVEATTEPVTIAAMIDRPGADNVLLGPVPSDDAGLTRLAQELTALEESVTAGATEPQPTSSGSPATSQPARTIAKDDTP
ncbi:hypothetical protein SAMN05892883_2393 [Jatrophihabitans sp. GAS493]|uniref:DUF4350 domain-containing protein n=1 Tax=Jatrophihabitans sp. GAS493 TaxID=1907575 RepID=UPI000BB710B3|nr:DUF4350 domain-containing protein [Jatrophihabitans sp. GAS493]SOD73098.1 hypothetical protein SAMN05892883_2393 [Jatrophihabitans sp. GAS493]